MEGRIVNLDAYKILVVDDEPVVANITAKTIATELENEIIVTTSAEKALDLVRKEEIGVLVCDLQMPKVDGTEILKAAWEHNGHVVSILVTARATKEAMIKAVNEGHIWKCIEKPWKTDELIGAVKEALVLYNEAVTVKKIDLDEEFATLEDAVSQFDDKALDQAGGAAYARVAEKDAGADAGRKKIRLSRAPAFRVKATAGVAPMILGKSSRRRFVMMDKRYRDLELIKEGGSGSIYKAQDGLLGMAVAIKVVAERFTHDRKALTTLFEEARIAMQLSHKHIVRLHNIEESKGFFYLVMEYIEGCTVRELLDKRKVLSSKLTEQIIDVCADAVGFAHRRRVYHRDLKPDNLMLGNDGVLKIIDFGLACLAKRKGPRNEIHGTPYYVSPEEIRGEPIDHRSDIFSLGVMAHEFLTGRLPFALGEPIPDMFNFVPVCSRRLPPPVRFVLERSFNSDRNERWDDIQDFAEALKAALCEASAAVRQDRPDLVGADA